MNTVQEDVMLLVAARLETGLRPGEITEQDVLDLWKLVLLVRRVGQADEEAQAARYLTLPRPLPLNVGVPPGPGGAAEVVADIVKAESYAPKKKKPRFQSWGSDSGEEGK